MKKNNKKISIIVPIYNGEKFLDECIESILNQTYKNIEIILVNDGSTDESLNICNKYKKEDKRIIILNIKNNGVANARNEGIKKSTGEYISFVDSDDILFPSYIETLYTTINRENVDVVRCNYIKKDYENGKETKGNLSNLKDKKYFSKDFNELIINFCTLNNNIPCYVWLLLIRKDKIIEFDKTLKYMEDTDFYMRLLMNINNIYFLNEYLYVYRVNNEGISNSRKKIKNNIEAILNSGIKIKKNLEKYKINNDELNKNINAYLVTTIIKKLKKMDNIRKTYELFYYLENNIVLDDILNNISSKDISKKIFLEYFFLKKKKYKLLFKTIIIKKYIKGCVR